MQSIFSTLLLGLEDDILETSFGWWADTAASYCPGKPAQIVLKSITKHRDRVEKTLCRVTKIIINPTRYATTRVAL